MIRITNIVLGNYRKDFVFYKVGEKRNKTKTSYEAKEVDSVLFSVKREEKSGEKSIEKNVLEKYISIYLDKKKKNPQLAQVIVDKRTRLVARSVITENYNPNAIIRFKNYFHNEFYVLKEGKEPVLFSNTAVFKSYKKRLKKTFSDCPSLINKIENKHFKKNDIEQIVEFYNMNCN